MNILSVQSWVSYGHVGNAAALFPLQRLGAEVWTVNTVQFSNHPGYGSHAGRPAGGAAVAELLDGLAARGVPARLDAILSGYLGDKESLDAVLHSVSRGRASRGRASQGGASRGGASRGGASRPELLFCCDPVLGDRDPDGSGPGVYVAPALARALREQAVPQADILTPNLFELGFLLGRDDDAPVRCSLHTLVRDTDALRRRMRPEGPGLILVTSAQTDDMPPGEVALFLSGPDGCHMLRTPRLPIRTNGAGDMLAALFLWGLLSPRDPVAALEHAASAVWCVLEHTARHGAREPMIVQAQEQLVSPTTRFRAIAVPPRAREGDRRAPSP